MRHGSFVGSQALTQKRRTKLKASQRRYEKYGKAFFDGVLQKCFCRGKNWLACELSKSAQKFLSDEMEGKAAENEFLQQFDESGRKLLILAKQWVCNLLPHCLSKRHGIDYGLIHESHVMSWMERHINGHVENERRLLLAVPFVGKDCPSSSAEFASPDVTIGLTTFAYRHEASF